MRPTEAFARILNRQPDTRTLRPGENDADFPDVGAGICIVVRQTGENKFEPIWLAEASNSASAVARARLKWPRTSDEYLYAIIIPIANKARRAAEYDALIRSLN